MAARTGRGIFPTARKSARRCPPRAGENSPEWLAQDRAYQTAAALFYAGKFAEARAAFEQIANDKNSVWNQNRAVFASANLYPRVEFD
ncbi:MAG: hypothetical protein WKF71_15155 [Pyrinomonadaceae bacterium]